MPTLNLTKREAALLDRTLDAYIGTDEGPEVQDLQPIREKLADLWAAGRWRGSDARIENSP